MRKRPPAAIGVAFLLFAILTLAIGKPTAEAPGWATTAGGIMFGSVGIGIILSSYGRDHIGKWFSLVGLIAFLEIFNYAGYGPGPRTCTGGLSIAGFSMTQGAHDCKTMFKVGAAALDVLFAAIVWYNFVRRPRQGAN